MIKNERQLGMTRSQLRKFQEHLSLIEKEKEKGEVSSLLDIEENAIRQQITRLEDQINEYEYLWKSGVPIPELQSIEDIPSSLIKARLSLGLTQKELAELVGLKEQQIQRYESTDYETASISRIQNLVNILNLQLSENIELPTVDITLREFFSKMRNIGIDRDFLVNRLIPPQASVNIKQARRSSRTLSNISIQVIGHIARIFGLTPREILGPEPLSLNVSRLGLVRYKVPKRTNKLRLNAHSFYAYYLAQMMLRSTRHLPLRKIPTDPYQINKKIVDAYGSISIKSALRYIWSLGVPVLSIDDPGGFHGAHFRVNGRNIILLKHRTDSRAIWLFSLFHELWHASEHQSDLTQNILEFEDIQSLSSGVNRLTDEEIKANKFASVILIGKNPDKLLHQCLNEAQNDIYKLKNAVIKIAELENVPVDALANYIAYRLQYEKGENWWGTAQNLQVQNPDIQLMARNVLLDNVDLSTMSGLDLDLLRRALLTIDDK